MKLLTLALVLLASQAHARDFLRGTINLTVTYSTLESGTQHEATIPSIQVNVSDDAKFCELHLNGVVYPCEYNLGGNGDRTCSDETAVVVSKNANNDMDPSAYNCSYGPVIGLKATTIAGLLRQVGLSPVLLANLNAKMASNMKDGYGRSYPNMWFTVADADVKATADPIAEGTQVHDDIHPDSFHIKSEFTAPLAQF